MSEDEAERWAIVHALKSAELCDCPAAKLVTITAPGQEPEIRLLSARETHALLTTVGMWPLGASINVQPAHGDPT